MDSQAHISLDTRTCAVCGTSKPLDHFDPRFIHKGTRVTCAECRGVRDAAAQAAWERARAEQEAEEAAQAAHDRVWWASKGFLRGARVGGAALRCDDPCHIYALADPRTQHMYYVGRTQDLQGRFRSHLNLRPSARWSVSGAARTREVLAAAMEPRLLTLETIYPCSGIYTQWSGYDWLAHSSVYDPALAYDLYVSEREARRMLWASARGHPIMNHLFAVSVAELVAVVDTRDIDFLTVSRTHPVWVELAAARMDILRDGRGDLHRRPTVSQ